MQISSASNLGWLSSTQASAAGGPAKSSTRHGSSAHGGGFDAASTTQAPTLSTLSSPSQLFSSANLSALISAQAGGEQADDGQAMDQMLTSM